MKRTLSIDADTSDEELMRQLAGGQPEAIGPLHARYASLIHGVAARTFDRATAEEISQEVFLAVWRHAANFDPTRGTFRAWVLQITRSSVLNELRRRGRRPRATTPSHGSGDDHLPDPGPDPAESAWREHRRAVVRAAVQALPPPQREALSLAFLEDLTHEQVAAFLNLPLGTTKSRIRSGLKALHRHWPPWSAQGLILAGLLTVAGLRDHAHQAALRRQLPRTEPGHQQRGRAATPGPGARHRPGGPRQLSRPSRRQPGRLDPVLPRARPPRTGISGLGVPRRTVDLARSGSARQRRAQPHHRRGPRIGDSTGSDPGHARAGRGSRRCWSRTDRAAGDPLAGPLSRRPAPHPQRVGQWTGALRGSRAPSGRPLPDRMRLPKRVSKSAETDPGRPARCIQYRRVEVTAWCPAPPGGQGGPPGPPPRSPPRIFDIEVGTTVQQPTRNIDHALRSSPASLRPPLAGPRNRDGQGRDVRGAGRISLTLGRGVDERPDPTDYRRGTRADRVGRRLCVSPLRGNRGEGWIRAELRSIPPDLVSNRLPAPDPPVGLNRRFAIACARLAIKS